MVRRCPQRYCVVLRLKNAPVDSSLGVDTFHYKWRLQVVIIPLVMLSVPCTLYLIKRRANPIAALANLTSNAFFVVFFCYPRICTNSFAVFICRVVQLDPTVSVLEADDRVLCQDSDHAIYQYASILFIGAVSVGVPLGVAILLFREYRRLPSVSQSLKVRVSDAFGISIEEAGPAVHDVTMGSAYGFLVDAFKPQFYLSESVDMLRKLCLVGLVVLFDRGSVVQLLATLCISIAFMFWHVKAWPYKIDLVRRLCCCCLAACAIRLRTVCVVGQSSSGGNGIGEFIGICRVCIDSSPIDPD